MPVGRHRVYTGVNVRADFRLERRDIAKLAQSTAMRNIVVGIARNVAMPYAKSISEHLRETGDYSRSFRTVSNHVSVPPEWPMRRVVGRLLNISDHAIFVEVGKHDQGAHHIMRKTLEFLDRSSGGGGTDFTIIGGRRGDR